MTESPHVFLRSLAQAKLKIATQEIVSSWCACLFCIGCLVGKRLQAAVSYASAFGNFGNSVRQAPFISQKRKIKFPSFILCEFCIMFNGFSLFTERACVRRFQRSRIVWRKCNASLTLGKTLAQCAELLDGSLEDTLLVAWKVSRF